MQERMKVRCGKCSGIKGLQCELCHGEGYYKIDQSLESLPAFNVETAAKTIHEGEVFFRVDNEFGHQSCLNYQR